jgi:hypothetical protein
MAAPGDVATLDRSTWPEQLSSPTLFDVASRAEILMFARVLLASEALDEPALAQRLGCARSTWRDQPCAPAPVAASVEQLQLRPAELRPGCVVLLPGRGHADPARAGRQVRGQRGQLLHQMGRTEPPVSCPVPGRAMRKAALFPQTSSEVDRFGDYERNGDEMHDRLFLLTFDSAANAMPDNTDWVTDYLRKRT